MKKLKEIWKYIFEDSFKRLWFFQYKIVRAIYMYIYVFKFDIQVYNYQSTYILNDINRLIFDG